MATRIAFLLLLLFALPLPSRAEPLDRKPLSIETADGKSFAFTVEVARTPEQQEQGLMFRKQLAPDAGMIFPSESERPVVFWMKNTLIPLDMLFVAGDLHIAHIVADAKPLSLDTIPSGGPVIAVVEVAGGTAKRLGIHVGDRVRFAGLGSSQ